MISKKPLPLPASPTREVSLHLWPAGEERRAFDWKSVQSLLVRRRKPLLITFGVVMTHLLLALSLLAPLYRATSTLQVNTGAISSGNEGDLPVVSEITGAGRTRTLTTQIEILQNEGVRNRALQLLKPTERAAVNTGSATVKAIPDTDLLNITAASRNPRAAAAYSNALATAYLQLSRNKNGAQYAAARQYVGQQLQATRARLNRARADIASYKKSAGTMDIAAESQNQLSELNRVQSEWSRTRADKEASVAQLNNLRATLSGLPVNVVAKSVVAQSPSVLAKKTSLTALETQLITARQEYRPSSPEVRALEEQIAGLRRQLQSEAQTEVQSQESSTNPVRLATEQQITTLQGQVWSLEARGVALKANVKSLQADLAKLPGREERMGQLNTDLTGLQQSYDTLNQRYQSLRASEAARVASGSLLFAAQTPTGAESRLNPLSLVMCLALASLAALAVASVIDRIDSRVHSPRDLTDGAELPVLAQIPFILNASGQSLLSMQSPVSPLLENFRGLRTMLALSSINEDGQSMRSLAVTSSLPNEGKSLTALNLAVAAAKGGERVILVDCDLRRPSQHRLSGLDNHVGFINVANGEVPLESALQDTSVPGLRILTSGPIVSNPFHALNSRTGREILKRVEEIADFVVIDTPPVLVLADARITATFADSVILVVSTEEPGKDEVALASDLLAQCGAHVSGIVLNKVAAGPDFRDYYSRYPYYTVGVDSVTHSIDTPAPENPENNGRALKPARVRDNSRANPRNAERNRSREDEPEDEGSTMVSYRPSRSESDD